MEEAKMRGEEEGRENWQEGGKRINFGKRRERKRVGKNIKMSLILVDTRFGRERKEKERKGKG